MRQRDLSNMLGVAPSTISTWKARGYIPPEQVVKLSIITGTSFEDALALLHKILGKKLPAIKPAYRE